MPSAPGGVRTESGMATCSWRPRRRPAGTGSARSWGAWSCCRTATRSGEISVGRVIPDAAVVVKVDGFRDLGLDFEHRGTVGGRQQPPGLHQAGVQSARARRAGQAPAAGAAALLPFPPLLALLVLAGGLRAHLTRAVRVPWRCPTTRDSQSCSRRSDSLST